MIPGLSFDGGRGSFCESWFFDTDTRAIPPLSRGWFRRSVCPRARDTAKKTNTRTRRAGVISCSKPFVSRLPTPGTTG
jgi:hypothetical protein